MIRTKMAPENKTNKEVAVFGGGCFWCTEAIFSELRGVESVRSGYAGGSASVGPESHPTYDQVCSGTTGHAEVVRIEFDPAVITYRDLLEVFFATHNPTTSDRQGHDVGSQYRSLILYVSDRQRAEAEAYIRELDASGIYRAPIVTQVQPLIEFYDAENYHQEYYLRNSGAPYCQVVIDPKLEELRTKFNKLIK